MIMYDAPNVCRWSGVNVVSVNPAVVRLARRTFPLATEWSAEH